MQTGKALSSLLNRIQETKKSMKLTKNHPPLLIKIAPDLDDSSKKDIAKICLDKQYNISGLVVSNTTVSRPAELQNENKRESGGLSGKPLKELSTQCVKDFRILTKGLTTCFS